ncbi:MAG: DUF1449 family protein [Bacteroidota bacterium]|nr:DUF1449 family protein [Bacteroidota bacterium]
MKELFDLSFSLVNIIPTTLLSFVIVYWIAVIFGAMDISFMDFDIDLNGEAGDSISWFNSALAFFNLGRVPIMVFLSFFALPFWIISVIFNGLFGNVWIVLSFLFLIPSIIASLFVSKFATYPFVKLFAHLEKDFDSNDEMVGKVCTLMLPLKEKLLGQANVNIEGSQYLLNVKTESGQSLERGSSALIIEYRKNEKLYIVEAYEHPNL